MTKGDLKKSEYFWNFFLLGKKYQENDSNMIVKIKCYKLKIISTGIFYVPQSLQLYRTKKNYKHHNNTQTLISHNL